MKILGHFLDPLPTQCPGYFHPDSRLTALQDEEEVLLLNLAARARGTGSIESSVGQDQAPNELVWVKDSYARTVFFENWDNLFLAKHHFFFWEWEEKECGKSSRNLTRSLGHKLCITKHIFDEWSVNQSKPDKLSSLCWLQNTAGEVPLLNGLGTCWNQSFAKVWQSPHERRELGLLVPLCRMRLNLLRGKNILAIPNQTQLQ